MDLNKDYYSVLGLNKSSSESDIKKAFRKKAVETHPDKNGGSDIEFKKINEAYSILSDDKLKQEYDIKSPHGNNYNPNIGFGPGSFFKDFGNGFSFSFGGFDNSFDPFEFFNDRFFNRKTEFQEDLNINLSIKVTLSDIYNNSPIKVKYTRNVSCNVCNGTGFDPKSESYTCEVCNGTGKVREHVIGIINCKYCNGTGKIHSGTCTNCNGDKIKSVDEEFIMNNIYKIQNSDTKYIKNYGHQSKYYRNKKGDLILNIIFEDDERFTRKKDGLYFKLNVHYDDAIKGTDLEFLHLDKSKYKVKIPPKTKDGDVLKMSKKGMLIDKDVRQNLYLIVNITIDYSRIK